MTFASPRCRDVRRAALVVGVVLGAVALAPARAEAQPQPTLHTASAHPMQYYLSLPDGWRADKKWPVLLALESSERAWLTLANRYIAARQNLAYILVVPLIVTSSDAEPRLHPAFHYPPAAFDLMAKVGQCAFDQDGVAAVLDDVERLYGGEHRVYATGFSGGGRLLWALVFEHPERLMGAASASGNFNGACVKQLAFSTDESRKALRVVSIGGKQDRYRPALDRQFAVASALAQQHDYPPIANRLINGGHDAYPAEVLEFFQWLRSQPH
jgi:dienelactone hydrolase